MSGALALPWSPLRRPYEDYDEGVLKQSLASFLLVLVLSACGAAPGEMNDQRVKVLKAELNGGGTWKCDRWAGGWGGSLSTGIKFGAWLSEHQVTVEVPAGEICASAAALAAMGAPRLVKSATGVLAFHGPTPALPPVQRVLLKALLEMWKVPEEIADRIMALQPGEFWTPKGDALELLEASRRDRSGTFTASR